MITIQERPLSKSLKRALYHGVDFGLGAVSASWCWRAADTGYLLSVDGEPVSFYRLLRHRCQINGELVDIGGMGGLVTVPARQRQGYAGRLVRHVLGVLEHEWHVAAALCFSLDHRLAFHEGLGGRRLACPVEVQSRVGLIPSPFHVLLWPFRAGLWPVRTMALGSELW